MGVKAVAAGWGTLTEEGRVSCTLQEVEVPVLSNEECRNTKYTSSMITDNMLCAGYPKTGQKDSCQVYSTKFFNQFCLTLLFLYNKTHVQTSMSYILLDFINTPIVLSSNRNICEVLFLILYANFRINTSCYRETVVVRSSQRESTTNAMS